MLSRAAAFRIHSWLGVVTGLAMIAVAWSGSLVVFNDEIEWLLSPAVRADPARGLRPLDEVVATVQAAHPGRRLAVHLQLGPHWVHTAYVYDAGGTRFLQIDPATAAIRTDTRMDGYTWNVAYFLRQLHVRLLMGYWGRVFVGMLGVTLVLSVVTSCWIYREWLRSLVRLRRGYGRRIFHMDLHKAIGLWSLAFNMLFGITGAILGLENLYYRIWPRPAAAERVQATSPIVARLSPHLTPGRAIAQVQALDAAFEPTSIEVWPDRLVVRGNHPGAFTAEGQSAYTIVPATGHVIGAVDARRASWRTYLYNLLDPIHFGYFGERWGLVAGYAIEGVWCLAGLAPGVLSLTGGVMWLLRQQRRKAARAAVRAMAPPGVPAVSTPCPASRRSYRARTRYRS